MNTASTGTRRWFCVSCKTRIMHEEALSGKLPDRTTECEVCGVTGAFKLIPSLSVAGHVLWCYDAIRRVTDGSESQRIERTERN